MKTFWLAVLMPFIILTFSIALIYYLISKKETWLEFWNDIFEDFWI